MKAALPLEQHDAELRRMHRAGRYDTEIAAALSAHGVKVTRGMVGKARLARGLEANVGPKRSTVARAVKLYAEGKSLRAVARTLKVGHYAVREWLLDEGVELRPVGARKKATS